MHKKLFKFEIKPFGYLYIILEIPIETNIKNAFVFNIQIQIQ